MTASKMSVFLFLLVLLALVGGIIFYFSHSKNAPTPTQVSQNVLISPTPTPILPAGTSDTQLNSDMTQIDNNINSLNTDTTTIDQGLNDQQGNLQ
jgi:hypothetical protein